MNPAPAPRAPTGLILGALLIVYVVWGSTYLAIRVVVREVPPFMGMGSRYVVAGALLGLILAARGGFGRLRLTRAQLLGCAYMGLMLPVLGNGLVALGESLGAPSGITAVLIATTPLSITFFRAVSGDRPHRLTLLGVGLGFVGVGVVTSASSAPSVSSVEVAGCSAGASSAPGPLPSASPSGASSATTAATGIDGGVWSSMVANPDDIVTSSDNEASTAVRPATRR